MNLLAATCGPAMNFLAALSSIQSDWQNAQTKFGPITNSFDASKRKNEFRARATPCVQPRSRGPQALGTAEAVHAGSKFSSCNFGYRTSADLRPIRGAVARAWSVNTICGAVVRTLHHISWIAFRWKFHQD